MLHDEIVRLQYDLARMNAAAQPQLRSSEPSMVGRLWGSSRLASSGRSKPQLFTKKVESTFACGLERPEGENYDTFAAKEVAETVSKRYRPKLLIRQEMGGLSSSPDSGPMNSSRSACLATDYGASSGETIRAYAAKPNGGAVTAFECTGEVTESSIPTPLEDERMVDGNFVIRHHTAVRHHLFDLEGEHGCPLVSDANTRRVTCGVSKVSGRIFRIDELWTDHRPSKPDEITRKRVPASTRTSADASRHA